MAFDLTAWLNDLAKDGSMSAEDMQVISQKFSSNATILKRLEEGQLRQSDYSRRMNDLQRKEQTLQATEQALNQWKTDAEAKLQTAVTERDQFRTTASQYEARVREISAEYGLDPVDVLNRIKQGLPATTPAPAATQPQGGSPVDTSKFLTREVLEQEFQKAQTSLPLVQAALIDLNAQHMQLFGQPLNNASALMTKALQEKRTLHEVWEEENRVPERRAQIDAQRKADDEARIRADERQKVLSEQSVPFAQRPDAHRAPIFSAVAKPAQDGTPPPQQTVPAAIQTAVQQARGVEAAVRAFNEGKYRPNAG